MRKIWRKLLTFSHKQLRTLAMRQAEGQKLHTLDPRAFEDSRAPGSGVSISSTLNPVNSKIGSGAAEDPPWFLGLFRRGIKTN